MFVTFLLLHSLFRWLVFITLTLSIFRSVFGWLQHKQFTKADNVLRHWTATTTHVQLVLGIVLYSKSPLISYYFSSSVREGDAFFFAVIHIALMLTSIVLVTIGSAKAKRQSESREKFKTILIFYTLALLCILVAIPWPFSPMAQRPFFRTF